MKIAKNRQPFLLLLLAVIFLGSLLIGFLPDFILHGTQLVNEEVHSSFEALGAMAAIAMSLLLLQFHQDGEREKGEFLLLSMGFLMMGILDTFVAVSVTGHGFNLLHSSRTAFGSIWFALVWLPGFGRSVAKKKSLPWIVAALSVLIGLAILYFRDYFPLMMLNGGFTLFAILINNLAGILLIAAGIYFLLEFLRSGTTESYLFTCVFFLLGLSSYEFRLSTVWTEDWWFWHVQRFLAYIVIFYYIFRRFLQVRNELKKMNRDLEKRIAERTGELSIEVAERKRYGADRDRVIVELQDALAHIITLTGLLPTCASCKRIRDAENNWVQMEVYIQKHSDATFTHGICPECAKKLYPEIFDKLF
jgi:signal transduction histidine kinase